MDYKRRLLRLQQALSENKLDSLLVTHLPNIRYLCGFSGSSGVLLMNEREAVFFSDGRYSEQARAEVVGAKVRISRNTSLSEAAKWMPNFHRRSRGVRVGIEGEHMTVSSRRRLAELLPGGFRLVEAPPLVERARMVKDQEEIRRMRAAVRVGASLFDGVLKTIRPGVKETEVAAAMECAARQAGVEEMSFPTIIAAGKRSAMPHARASSSAIPAGGFVVCDFGVILAGYCSDMTRTVYVGRPTREARRVYEAVQNAQQTAVDAVRPGASVGAVDGAARKVLQQEGLEKYFTHSTGHGVGLEIHESPRVAAGQSEVLRQGMVITIEPGVYVPRKLGVRIEDMVVVTERGCEVLTPVGKNLITI